VTERLARRFIVCRAATRAILADYVGTEAGLVEFTYGPHGKPSLSESSAQGLVEFNVSHSGDLAVLALAWRREVGVDVEAIKPIMHMGRMVQHCLGPAEQRAFYRNNAASQTERFLTYWTHKEAYLKAVGAGLQIPLRDVRCDLRDPRRPRITRQSNGEEETTSEYQVTELDLGPGYLGALVAQGSDSLEVQYTDWRVT
jgi:4'-phosphopantetheinyl transferase